MSIVRTLLALIAGLVALVLALPAALLVAPFLLVRACTAWLAERKTPEVAKGDPFVRFDGRVGWTPRANLDTHALDLNGDHFHFTTDADGWRGRQTLEDADVVVFGDSFAFGFGIDDDAFFGHLDSEMAVKAVGAPGYNMVQALHWMHELAPRVAGKTWVWLLYPPNDLEDNIRPSMLQYRTPFVRERKDGRWETVTKHLSDRPWPFPSRKRHIENYVEICSGTDLSRRVFSACAHLIREAATLAGSMDARLVVATVPELSLLANRQLRKARTEAAGAPGYDPERPDRRIAEICQKAGVPFVPLAKELTTADYLENDVHWNAAGHRKVHDVLRRIWREPPPPPAPVPPPAKAPATAGK